MEVLTLTIKIVTLEYLFAWSDVPYGKHGAGDFLRDIFHHFISEVTERVWITRMVHESNKCIKFHSICTTIRVLLNTQLYNQSCKSEKQTKYVVFRHSFFLSSSILFLVIHLNASKIKLNANLAWLNLTRTRSEWSLKLKNGVYLISEEHKIHITSGYSNDTNQKL